MRMFTCNNIVLFILVVTTTINASRIFYLPLPKFHSSNQQVTTPKSVDETTKRPISDEFIPSSAFEQEEIEKRGDNFDWEELLDKKASEKYQIAVDELLPGSVKQLAEQYRLNENNDNQPEYSKISQVDTKSLPEDAWVAGNTAIERVERLQSNPTLNLVDRKNKRNDTLFLLIVGVCCAVGVVGLVGAAVFWYKIQKRAEAAVDAEYPSYGVTGPNSSGSKISPSSTMSDRKLAQSAQMFHYQQQRQQMMAQEKAHLDAKPVHSDDSDDEAPAGGDYTVYECPGLAPTGEMEVRNPLFSEPDTSLMSPGSNSNPAININHDQAVTSISSSPKEKFSQ